MENNSPSPSKNYFIKTNKHKKQTDFSNDWRVKRRKLEWLYDHGNMQASSKYPSQAEWSNMHCTYFDGPFRYNDFLSCHPKNQAMSTDSEKLRAGKRCERKRSSHYLSLAVMQSFFESHMTPSSILRRKAWEKGTEWKALYDGIEALYPSHDSPGHSECMEEQEVNGRSIAACSSEATFKRGGLWSHLYSGIISVYEGTGTSTNCDRFEESSQNRRSDMKKRGGIESGATGYQHNYVNYVTASDVGGYGSSSDSCSVSSVDTGEFPDTDSSISDIDDSSISDIDEDDDSSISDIDEDDSSRGMEVLHAASSGCSISTDTSQFSNSDVDETNSSDGCNQKKYLTISDIVPTKKLLCCLVHRLLRRKGFTTKGLRLDDFGLLLARDVNVNHEHFRSLLKLVLKNCLKRGSIALLGTYYKKRFKKRRS